MQFIFAKLCGSLGQNEVPEKWGCPESTAYCRALKEQAHIVALLQLQQRPALPAGDRPAGPWPWLLLPEERPPRRDNRARYSLQSSDFSGLRAWTIPALQGSPCLHTQKGLGQEVAASVV